MSVKCLTTILDRDGRELCVLGFSINGQLTGHGVELKQILRGHAIVSEHIITDRQDTAPSMGHLAVIFIKRLKLAAGLLELLPGGSRNFGEEYIYSIYPRHTSRKIPSLLNLRIEAALSQSLEKENVMTVIYNGLLDEFDPHAVQAEWSHGYKILEDSSNTRHPRPRVAAVNKTKLNNN